MALLFNSLLKVSGQIESLGWERAAEQPGRIQQEVLREILRDNAASEFGKTYRFQDIKTEKEFRSQIPIHEFEGFRPFVDRMMDGEPSVLTVKRPVMFTVTSGTTGKPKFIPVTHQVLKNEFTLLRRWYYQALLDHRRFLDHSRLAIVGSPVEGYTSAGIPIGNASGMIFQRVPRFLRRRYVIADEIGAINDPDLRYFVMARLALSKRISFVATPNPSTLIRLAEIIAQNQESLIRSIHDGALGVNLTGEGKDENRQVYNLKPDPVRARNLDRIAEKQGSLRPVDCWPDLKLIGCWLGGSVGMQAHKLATYYGNIPIRDLGYMASEGHFSMPCEDFNPSGLLAIRTNYFEFIEEDQLDLLDPEVRSCTELKEGSRYAMLVTTPGGLYRYNIHDVVEVTGFYKKSPLIAFVRKAGDMANLTGEKLHLNHVIAAFDSVQAVYRLPVAQFRVIPDLEAMCYAVYLELNDDALKEMVNSEVVHSFDQNLARVNLEYAQKRASKRLHPPRFHLMREGWVEAERRRYVAARKHDTQFKWKFLCPELTEVDREAIIRTVTADDRLLC